MIPYSPLDSINILRPQAFAVRIVKNTVDKAKPPATCKTNLWQRRLKEKYWVAVVGGNLRANFYSILVNLGLSTSSRNTSGFCGIN